MPEYDYTDITEEIYPRSRYSDEYFDIITFIDEDQVKNPQDAESADVT